MPKYKFDKFIPINKNISKNIEEVIVVDPNEHVYIFDIDETLYPENLAIKIARRKKYLEFLNKKGLSHDEAWLILNNFSDKYGVAIKGFIHEYNVSEDVYKELLERNISDYEILQHDYEGKEIFKNLKGTKICLTNSDSQHSKFVLEKIGLLEHIDYIFHCDYEDKNFICKPEETVFHIVEQVLGIKDRKKVHFFDDKLINVKCAQNFGWNSYLVTEIEDYKIILEKIKK